MVAFSHSRWIWRCSSSRGRPDRSVPELDDSDRTEIGDRVVAIGHPEQGGL
jgi:hypothetical protein